MGVSSAAPSLLPGAGNAAGIASEHGGVQITDVYSQFQGCSGHQTKKLAIEELALNSAPVFGKVPRPVRADLVPQRRRQLFLGVNIDEFGKLTSTGKYQTTNLFLNKLFEKKSRLAVGTASASLGLINERRIPEGEILLTMW